MKFLSIERSIIVALIVGIIGAVYVTNYARDHEVYRIAAEQCTGDNSVLGQEIEQLKAELVLKEIEVKALKSQPLR